MIFTIFLILILKINSEKMQFSRNDIYLFIKEAFKDEFFIDNKAIIDKTIEFYFRKIEAERNQSKLVIFK